MLSSQEIIVQCLTVDNFRYGYKEKYLYNAIYGKMIDIKILRLIDFFLCVCTPTYAVYDSISKWQNQDKKFYFSSMYIPAMSSAVHIS